MNRELINQLREDAVSVINLDHHRQLAKRDHVLQEIKEIVREAIQTQRKLSLFPPPTNALDVTHLIERCHHLNIALERISNVLKDSKQ